MTETKKPRRRWFRFSLRTFFILITIFGVWLGVQAKWVRDRREARVWVLERGYISAGSADSVGLGVPAPNGPTVSPYLNLLQSNPGSSRLPNYRLLVRSVLELSSPTRTLPWTLRMLGEEPARWIVIDSDGRMLTEDDWKHIKSLKRLFPEATLQVTTDDPFAEGESAAFGLQN